MKILRYTILAIIILNVPTFSLFYLGSTVGSFSALLFLVLMLIWFFLNKKIKPIIGLVSLGLSYFLISGLNSFVPTTEFISDVIKYFIFIICIVSLAKETTSEELCYFFLAGALTVLISAIAFTSAYGRYSGFYLNPNAAGLICLLGFAFSYDLKNKKMKFFIQFLFAISGLVTLSRYFILLIIIVNLVSIFANRKNIIGLLAAIVSVVILLNTSYFQLNTDRFNAFQSVFSDDVDTKTITKGSRNETWAIYSDVIMENIIIGSGYKSAHGRTYNPNKDVGVHNTYLMVLAEAGIISFIIIIIFYLTLFIKSFKRFKITPNYLYIAIILFTYLLGIHNYFYNYVILLVTIWLHTKVNSINTTDNSLNPI